MTDLILAIDQGTTGSTAMLIDAQLNIISRADEDFPQHFPKPGWVEHDLNEIWASIRSSVKSCIAKSNISADRIAAIGITNQRETTCVWNRKTEQPVSKAIVWQDRRTAHECLKLKRTSFGKTIPVKTGLLLDPYFSATKLRWLLKENPSLKTMAKNGDICFGTIDSFILFKLTEEHATDPSNACRTLLMNLKTRKWDKSLLDFFGIPEKMLPRIQDSAGLFGKTKGIDFLPDGIPVTGIIGDQQSALVGQACFKPGDSKCTYGTGAFILQNIGKNPVISKHRLLTSVAWQIGNEIAYCFEGSAFIAGAAIQWLRDELGIIANSSDVEKLASETASSEGVMFVPAMSGFGAPHWLPNATGLLTGITRGTKKSHIARAFLDGIALQIVELLTAMQKDSGKKIREMKADGGAAENNLLMQFQADMLHTNVVRPTIVETTSLGAGIMAALGVGLFSGFGEVSKNWKMDRIFKPTMKNQERKAILESWSRAISAMKLLSAQ